MDAKKRPISQTKYFVTTASRVMQPGGLLIEAD